MQPWINFNDTIYDKSMKIHVAQNTKRNYNDIVNHVFLTESADQYQTENFLLSNETSAKPTAFDVPKTETRKR